MVEELKLEKIYAQRGIELITPAAGTRILDRLISQKTPNVVAISVDWMQARRAAIGGRIPPMFSELGTAEISPDTSDSECSALDFLSACPADERFEFVAGHVQQIAAAVFEIPVADIGPDDALDDIGLDSLMAMDFRLRVNAMFTIDLPLLELLRGVSVNSVTDRILADLRLTETWPAAGTDEVPQAVEAVAAEDDVDRLIEELSEDELRAVLAELENQGGARS
jgi:acyl carrier protein